MLPSELIASMTAAWDADDPGRVIALAAAAPAAARNGVPVLALLGLAQQRAGQHGAAVRSFERLCRLQPAVSAWWNNLGVARREAGDGEGAVRALLRARELAPADADVPYNLGLLYLQQQRWPAAREVLLHAVELAPAFIDARLRAAHACHMCGNVEGEEAMLEGAGHWPPQAPNDALLLASMLGVLGRLDAALAVLGHADLPAGPAGAALRLRFAAQRAALYERNNRPEQARAELERVPLTALENLPEDARATRIEAWRAHAALALRERRFADAIELHGRVLALAQDDDDRALAAFGMAAAYDRQGRYADAWQALTQAHAAQLALAARATDDLAALESRPLPMATRRVTAADYAAWAATASAPARPSPVFVIGFPRSGTTLLEQMLDAHPDFRSMDERGHVYQLIERMEHAGQHYPADLARLTAGDIEHLRAVYWRLAAGVVPDLDAQRLVDKNPLNLLCLPMILRLFPDAHVILCLRHPCDVLLSCTMQAFRSPAFMVMCATLPRLARGYADAFAQCCGHLEVFRPHLLEWRYEAVVADFPAAVARLGQFLELADPAPLAGFAQHARAKAFIATPSYAQVTQPLNAAAVGRWQHYREHFAPALPILQPWLDRFGYGVQEGREARLELRPSQGAR